MKNQIGEDLDLRSVVSSILQNTENWLALQEFAEIVMTKKRVRKGKWKKEYEGYKDYTMERPK